MQATERWQQALEELAPLARHHAGPDMDAAYERLISFYPKAKLDSYRPGTYSGHWAVPPGWVVKKAKLFSPAGEVIADYANHPLRLFTYSPPFSGKVTLAELQHHLMSDPERPNAIPFHFRNQYRHWEPEWGFCLTQEERDGLVDGDYYVEIECDFVKSDLRMAIQSHRGEHDDCFLLIGHFDHPGMAGDGLIGCLAGHEAISRMEGRATRLTYRMLSTVEIVGSVFYANNRAHEDAVREGLFSALSGVDAPLKYAKTAKERAQIDRVMAHVLSHILEPAEIVGFRQAIGNDEIAFDVHGINVPCGSLMRWPYEHYHTHFDSADKIDVQKMETFIGALLDVIEIFEKNSTLTGNFDGLPQLGHPDIDLYLSPGAISGIPERQTDVVKNLLERLPDQRSRDSAARASGNLNMLMTLIPPLADGTHTTLDVAERSGVPFALVDAYTDMWKEKGLLSKEWIHPFKEKETQQ